jgi:hypothetical protein
VVGTRHGQHHDPSRRQPGRELAHQLDAVHAGQIDIDEQHVGTLVERHQQGILCGCGLGDHLDIRRRDRLAHG